MVEGFFDLPAVFHVERFIHAAGDLNAEVFVGGTFWYFHFMPFGKLKHKKQFFINKFPPRKISIGLTRFY